MTDNVAFILGYTGATGQALVRELMKDDYFKKIVLVGRRKTDLPAGADDRFVLEVVDYDNIGEYGHVFKDCTVGFCCLGCSIMPPPKDLFELIDRDYVINTATVAKAAGCRHFHLITAVNTDINSKINYRKVKAETEEGVSQLGFDKLNIYRPGYIINDIRKGGRYAFECVYRCLCFPCLCCCKKTKSITVESFAKAMLYKTKNPAKEKVEILENIDIYECGN